MDRKTRWPANSERCRAASSHRPSSWIYQYGLVLLTRIQDRGWESGVGQSSIQDLNSQNSQDSQLSKLLRAGSHFTSLFLFVLLILNDLKLTMQVVDRLPAGDPGLKTSLQVPHVLEPEPFQGGGGQ
jgi:hypothetical protein